MYWGGAGTPPPAFKKCLDFELIPLVFIILLIIISIDHCSSGVSQEYVKVPQQHLILFLLITISISLIIMIHFYSPKRGAAETDWKCQSPKLHYVELLYFIDFNICFMEFTTVFLNRCRPECKLIWLHSVAATCLHVWLFCFYYCRWSRVCLPYAEVDVLRRNLVQIAFVWSIWRVHPKK